MPKLQPGPTVRAPEERPTPLAPDVPPRHARPRVAGKFLEVDGQKLYLRGVTYGTFPTDGAGDPLPAPETVGRDFAAMRAAGVNAVRVYTAPPTWFLDLALAHGLYVMVGLPWEQHVAFLDDRRRADDIVRRVTEQARRCADHPAVLCFAFGNEIPSSIARWHGRRRVERFLRRLYLAVKRVAPETLVTYVNFPTTEYLDLPFVDFVAFNVFLETHDQLEAYVARLQNIAGDRPLVLAELGLDSRRNGVDAQAAHVADQIATSFAGGCAGVFVFSWTDEWHRNDVAVDDWDFGLVDRAREAKPALAAAMRAFAEVPFAPTAPMPPFSVVVCSRNGGRTIGACLDGIARLDYPEFEVLVVDDGSTDDTAEVARRAGARVVSTANQGLSAARNLGVAQARHDLIAFLDDDTVPDRDWLRYLAHAFGSATHAGVGGPNIPPADSGLIEQAVARGPGGPIHVLLSDDLAEHIPGCNMAFRRAALAEIGGFDTRFRIAGDDVDICWRLLAAGHTLGFAPAAMVWHRRRTRLAAYVRQQREYGKAEALLERKWPERYNGRGHVAWSGQVYGAPRVPLGRRERIYYGLWGTSLFQSVYSPASRPVPLMPEWYPGLAALVLIAVPGLFDRRLLFSAPLLGILALSVATLLVRAGLAGWSSSPSPRSSLRELWLRLATSSLFLIQPAARLWGRARHGLTPWRRRPSHRFVVPVPRRRSVWSERWHAPDERLSAIEAALSARGVEISRGGAHDRWDLDVRVGSLGGARLREGIEEHGQGKQLVRFSVWPVLATRTPLALLVLLAVLALSVGHDLALTEVAAILVGLVATLGVSESGRAQALLLEAVARQEQREEPEDDR